MKYENAQFKSWRRAVGHVRNGGGMRNVTFLRLTTKIRRPMDRLLREPNAPEFFNRRVTLRRYIARECVTGVFTHRYQFPNGYGSTSGAERVAINVARGWGGM